MPEYVLPLALLVGLALLSLLLLRRGTGPSYRASARYKRFRDRGNRDGERWIQEHVADLAVGKWVAADGSGLLAQADTMTKLLGELRRKRLRLERVAIRFVEIPEPATSPVVSSRHPGSVWIEQNAEALPVNHWIAATGEGLVAASLSSEKLHEQLAALRIDLSSVCICFHMSPGPSIERQTGEDTGS